MLDFTETVEVRPSDLRSVIATIHADLDVPPAEVRAALDTLLELVELQFSDDAWTVPAQELWRVVRYADPENDGSGLDSGPSHLDCQLVAHVRVWSAVQAQAPRTAAAMELVMQTETELAITAARLAG